MQIGLQLYTLRTLEESLPETIRRVGNLPFEGVQFAGFGDTSPEELRSALDETGLAVAGAHVGIDEIEDHTEETVSQYRELGCTDLVVPSYEHEAFAAEEPAREAGRRLAALADRLAEDDMVLHYHNHTFEFTPLSEGTAFDAFAAAADGVALEIDTGLANHAGVDPVALLERYADRISLVHLTDSNRGDTESDTRHLDLGTGDVDLAGCVEAARAGGADWVLFEHGLTDDPIASVESAGATMVDLVSP